MLANEELYNPGTEYRIGMSDGKVFEHMEYVGPKLLPGSNYVKPVLQFLSLMNKHISVNPSYVAYIEEELIQSEGELKHDTPTSTRESITPAFVDNINSSRQDYRQAQEGSTTVNTPA